MDPFDHWKIVGLEVPIRLSEIVSEKHSTAIEHRFSHSQTIRVSCGVSDVCDVVCVPSSHARSLLGMMTLAVDVI